MNVLPTAAPRTPTLPNAISPLPYCDGSVAVSMTRSGKTISAVLPAATGFAAVPISNSPASWTIRFTTRSAVFSAAANLSLPPLCTATVLKVVGSRLSIVTVTPLGIETTASGPGVAAPPQVSGLVQRPLMTAVIVGFAAKFGMYGSAGEEMNAGVTTTCPLVTAAGTTVTTNVSVALSPPASVTVSETVAEPVCPAAGVTVTVRADPLPPSATLAAGTSDGFEVAAVTTRSAAAVSASPTENAIGPVPRPVVTTRSVTFAIVGGVFTRVGGAPATIGVDNWAFGTTLKAVAPGRAHSSSIVAPP